MQPGCAIAVQTFGELVNFNPHLHIIASDGCFNENGDFLHGISPNAKDLTAPFAKAVLKMLKKENVINFAVINNMSTWQHSGFNIHCGSPINCSDAEAVERLARYIVRAHVSQERLRYFPNLNSPNSSGKVIYEGKTTHKVETFSSLDFLARLATHIPNKREQTVRYYGYYSNKSRSVRAKADAINAIAPSQEDSTAPSAPATLTPSGSALISTVFASPNTIPISLYRKRFKKNWAGHSVTLHCSPMHPGPDLYKRFIMLTLSNAPSAAAKCALFARVRRSHQAGFCIRLRSRQTVSSFIPFQRRQW